VVVFGGISCTSQRYQPFPTLSLGAEELVDFVFLCGDQVYTDYKDTVEGKRREWASNLGSQGYRDLLSSTAVVATWDDHEIENAWGTDPTSDEVIEAGKTAFFEHTPTRVKEGEALYRSLRWADTLEIFVLDGRSERVASEGIYLSKTQFDWFVEAVTASTAHFKLVLNSVPIADFSPLFAEVEVEDRWDGYPEARWELLNALEGVENLFFISGDFHMGMVCHVEPEGFAWNFYDVLVGPGGQFANPIAGLMAPNPQFPVGVSARNFTRLVADPHANTLHVEYIGETGEILASIVLPEEA
jgi:alkaline phosphatase D